MDDLPPKRIIATIVLAVITLLLIPLIVNSSHEEYHAHTIKPIDMTPKQLVRHYSDEYGVDYKLVYAIIEAESGWYRYAQNPHSTADGYCQFLDGTWEYTMNMMDKDPNTSKFSRETSIEACVFLLAKEGSKHWDASKHVWGPKYK